MHDLTSQINCMKHCLRHSRMEETVREWKEMIKKALNSKLKPIPILSHWFQKKKLGKNQVVLCRC